MAVKFSEFTAKVDASLDLTEVVGYLQANNLNVRIPPANLDTTYVVSTGNAGASPTISIQGTKPGQAAAINPSTVSLTGSGGILLDGNGTTTIDVASTSYALSATDSIVGNNDVPVLLTGLLGANAHTDTLNLVGTGTIQVSSASGTITIDGGSTGDVTSITATAPIERDQATGDVTLSLADAGVTLAKIQNVAANSVLVRDANSSGVLTEKALATTEILIGNGAGVTSAALSADVTMTNAGAVTIAADAVTTAKVLNANITHAKLEARYTTAVTVSTLTGTYALDWSTGAVFVMSGSLSGAINFQFGSMKIGQVIDIYNLTGSQTVTFSTASGTPVFNKAGAVDYDGGETNLIQVQCVSDAANAVFNYAVSAYVDDSTPS